jgi:hypothetical protein
MLSRHAFGPLGEQDIPVTPAVPPGTRLDRRLRLPGLPARFVTAPLLRFGPHAPWLAHTGLIPHIRDVPTWFTSDASPVILGILAALKIVAERFPEAAAVLDEVHGYLKTGIAVLTYLAVLDATDRAAVHEVIDQAGVSGYLPVLAVGAGVYLATRVRGAVLGPLAEAGEDDDLGLHGLIRGVEDLRAALGPMALILFPLPTVAAFGLAALILVVIERRIESRAESAKVPCVHRGQPIPASAPTCPHCHAPIKDPRDVGLLGQPKDRRADPRWLPFRLAAVKRFPVCANRLDRRAVNQTCRACGRRLMDDPRFARDDFAAIARRVPSVFVVCFLLGLIPVLGVIAVVIYYQLTIVAPFRRYIPPGRGFLLRRVVRLAALVLVDSRWVSVAGGLAVPSVAPISYGAYRATYLGL